MIPSLLAGLFLASLQPVLASQAVVVPVPGDKIGDAASINDVAKPAANAPLHLTFAINSAQAQNIQAFANTLTDPKSPNFHKWLTPQQFGQKFGATTDDIHTVTSYLTQNNFSNIKVWSNKLFVTGDLPRASAEKLFGVTIHGYNRSQDRVKQGYSPTYFAPDSTPKVVPAVASVLNGVFGLSNYHQWKPTYNIPTPDAININPLGPADLSTAYDIDALHNDGLEGDGVTIAVFSPTLYDPTDLTAFFANYNISQPTINIVNVNGGATDNSDETEADLDLETIGGQAHGATINVYEGPNDGSLDIFQQVAQDSPNILSMSYGSPETDYTDQATFVTGYETLRGQMAIEGISIFVSSGDSGAFAGPTELSTVSVSLDASSANVTAVGGTELTLDNSVWQSEVAWTYNDTGTDAGSNGGLSIFFPLPSWQTGIGVNNSYSDNFRQVPDIAALAGQPYYNVYTGGAFTPIGGTSGACPLWASAIALIDEQLGSRLGNIDPSLYSFAANEPTVYHDITSGNNGVYFCTTGWDFVTGWGSSDFGLLAEAFGGTLPVSIPDPTNSWHIWNPGLQMISVPFNYAGTLGYVGNLFTGLSTATGTAAFTIAAWEPLDESYVVSPTPPAYVPLPGQAYWARFASTTGGLNKTPAGAPINSLTYGVSIAQGWNMIGDPFQTAVPIGNSGLQLTNSAGTINYSAAIADGYLSPVFYDYNGSAYVAHGSGDSLQPYDGYWLYSLTNGQLTFLAPGS